MDYGGSTGYGREYRRRLRGTWGVTDIDDVCAGAQELVRRGLADKEKMAIDGGSAGGFTTLGALAFKDVFTAGCSLYGVADCSALADDTHKFESRYLDGLIGKYPEVRAIHACPARGGLLLISLISLTSLARIARSQERAKYDARRALYHLEGFSCPILLLQGDEDKIVPPNQAEAIYEALKKKGIPCALRMYEGEQHGFRKSENIEDALLCELFFYAKVFGFTPKDAAPANLVIDNMRD